MKYPFKNLNSIALKSVELPLKLNNIRPLNGTTSISFTFTNNTYINITVSNEIVGGACTTVASLVTAINTALGITITQYSGLTLYFTTKYSSGLQVC